MKIVGQIQTQALSMVQNNVPTREFSERQMRAYFTQDNSLKCFIFIITLVAGLICLIAGMAWHAYFFLFVSVGLIFILVSWTTKLLIRLGVQVPTDEDYDAWVQSRARSYLIKALSKIDQDWLPEDEMNRMLYVHGFVLADTKNASKYRKQDLLSKLGKDGVRRYSTNVYTFFHPVEHQLAVFVFDINVVNHRDHREQVQEYFFSDVVAATTEFEQDFITDGYGEHAYRTESFALRICDGNRISVTIRSQPLDYEEGLPIYDLPITNVEQTIAKLRFLLRIKKQ